MKQVIHVVVNESLDRRYVSSDHRFMRRLNEELEKLEKDGVLNYEIQYQASRDHYSALIIYED